MGKIKVYELAKELEISSKETIEKLLKVGIEVKSHLSVIETEDADKIRKSSGNESKKHDTKIVKAQRHEAKAGETGASIPKKDSKPEVRPVHHFFFNLVLIFSTSFVNGTTTVCHNNILGTGR